VITPRNERLLNKEFQLALMASKKVESKLTARTSGKIKINIVILTMLHYNTNNYKVIQILIFEIIIFYYKPLIFFYSWF